VLLIEETRNKFNSMGWATGFPSGSSANYLYGKGSEVTGLKWQKDRGSWNELKFASVRTNVENTQATLCQSSSAPPPPPRTGSCPTPKGYTSSGSLRLNFLEYEGDCYYMDGTGGVCLPGYSTSPNMLVHPYSELTHYLPLPSPQPRPPEAQTMVHPTPHPLTHMHEMRTPQPLAAFQLHRMHKSVSPHSQRYELGNPGVLLIEQNREKFKSTPWATAFPTNTNSQYIFGKDSHKVGAKWRIQSGSIVRNTYSSVIAQAYNRE
jgi:hypothetical protein